MAKPPTVTREATGPWTLGWAGRLADRVRVPTSGVLAFRAFRWLVLRPVKTLAGLAVLWTGLRYGWLVGAALVAVLAVCDRILRSPGVAASGRVGRSYRACQGRGALRRAWPALMAETGLTDSAGRPMRHGWIRTTPTGYAVTVHNGAAAKTAGHVGNQAQVLAGLLAVHSVRTRRLDSARTDIMINTSDPLAGIITLDQLPQVQERSQVPIGIAEDGRPILWDAAVSTLLLGLPRSGKSSIVWVILDGIQRWRDQPIPELWVVDLKEGVELSELDPAAGGIAARFIDNPAAAERMIDELRKEGRERLRLMRKHGWRKWTPERAAVLGPRRILIIDEFLALPKKISDPEKGVLREILFLLPAAGITVVGCSQLTQVDASAIGRLRNFFGCKILLAVESVSMVVAALGEEGRSSAPAHLLQLPYDAGRLYMQQEGVSGYTHGKAAYVNDEDGEHVPIARGLVAA